MLVKAEKQSLLKTTNLQQIDGFIVYSVGSHWWSCLFKPWSHVSLILRKGSDYICFEPSTCFSDIVLLPKGTKWRECFAKDAYIQPFRIWRKTQGYRCWHLLQPFTCVEQVKAFLGIRKWWIFTPNQLKRYIENGQRI